MPGWLHFMASLTEGPVFTYYMCHAKWLLYLEKKINFCHLLHNTKQHIFPSLNITLFCCSGVKRKRRERFEREAGSENCFRNCAARLLSHLMCATLPTTDEHLIFNSNRVGPRSRAALQDQSFTCTVLPAYCDTVWTREKCQNKQMSQ